MSSSSPSARISTILVCALTLSVGWGIRGNFGHEYGAMIPGGLTAIAVCLMSGREDWRRRVAYFAFFGAVGWGFGGSMSYGQVIAYAHSGQFATQFYGYAGLFFIGFLWAAIGVAGTSFPAVADRDHLTKLFRPIACVFAVWWVWGLVGRSITLYFVPDLDEATNRHETPFYWFDADWLAALLALAAVCLYDVVQRRSKDAFVLPVYAAAGALAGFAIQWILDVTRLSKAVEYVFVRPVGDVDLFRRAEELGIGHESFTEAQRALLQQYNGNAEAFEADLLTNWPVFTAYEGFQPHLGWILGLLVGAGLYFWRYGAFRDGSRLILYMSAGFLISFLLFPVLLGIRMTPPRSDSWAGILGVYAGIMAYLFRSGLFSVAFASVVGGIIGGIGFSGADFARLVLLRPGNRQIVTEPDVVAQWAHWQSANWHSWLEQTYGFVNGIAVAVAIALIASRVRHVDDSPRLPRWSQIFSIAFVLLWLPFVNWRKAVGTWVDANAVAPTMKMPLLETIELSAQGWFDLVYWVVAAGFILLMFRHIRRPLPFIPPTALGKGLLLYLVFLWIAVIFNNERAITNFDENRLITEAVIFVNAILATVIFALSVRENESEDWIPQKSDTPQWTAAALAGIVIAAAVISTETAVLRQLYQGNWAGHSGQILRFGPDAEWRINPLRKTQDHN